MPSRSLPIPAVGLLLLLLAAAASASRVNVTVDNVVVHLVETVASSQLGARYKLDKLKPLIITCRAETSTQRSVRLERGNFDWRKAGQNVSLGAAESRASIGTECRPDGLSCVSVLTLRNPVGEDFGVYECHVTPLSVKDGAPMPKIVASGAFQGRPIIKMLVNGGERFDVAVWPTDKVNITCQVLGYPLGEIRWSQEFRPGLNYSRNETLLLTRMDYQLDRGLVTCQSSNDFGLNEATMFLRVKSPKAFLPPLLGIGAELVLMLVIIVSYEVLTKRKRREAAAASADGGGQRGAGAADGMAATAEGVKND